MKDLQLKDEGTLVARESSSDAKEVARVVAHVQARKVMAMKNPRDEIKAMARIAKACQRAGLAEIACYQFPRGGSKVTGPSIHLLKAVAQHWGNLSTDWEEIERNDGWSKVRAYAEDDETNFMVARTFIVKHQRDTKGGGKPLTDERDIDELVANMASRRQRACLESVIPTDVVDDAVRHCERTLAGNSEEPLADRAAKMLQAFEPYGVTQAMIEGRLGHKLEAITLVQLVTMKKIFASIRDAASAREDWFDVAGEPKPASEKTQDLNAKLKQKAPDAGQSPKG